MKITQLRICVLALGVALVGSQPALAGCAQICQPSGTCANTPEFPQCGCIVSGQFCLDAWCGPIQNADGETVAQLGAAALAGDTHTVALLAGKLGQPVRLSSGGKILYDGFILAGLKGPGSAASSTDRLAACGSSAVPAASEPAAQPAPAVVTEER